ncbi:MAG: insulinase family protein [Tissierellia bacterium]|nr:insulinase family protein [Tissierellia bacterium]
MRNDFTLIKDEYIEDLDSHGYLYEHNKTKAKLFFLKNDSKIKTFGVGFPTMPKDSTGVAHILEHSVLSGSRKYKTKEPFMDLINSSLQTFLNAMTYPDRTLYPVASRNKKDFYNLVDVYLDSVFYPSIYEDERMFKQEGWHYELDSADSDIEINGIVYNEMKGAYSDPEDQVLEQIAHNLHPGTIYAHDSGGYPYDIPNLKYEDFLNFHREFYTATNAYFYLYGDLDIDEFLDYLDKEYLSNMEYKEAPKFAEIPIIEKPFKAEVEYSVIDTDDKKDRDYLVYSVVLGEATEAQDLFMRNFLAELLMDAESAPVKKALMKAEIGEDCYSYLSSSLPLDFSFVMTGSNIERYSDFQSVIDSTLRNLIKNGIDRDLIGATLSKFQFQLREQGGIHKGVRTYLKLMASWIYGNDPFSALEVMKYLQNIKKGMNEGYLERYIERKILNNPQKMLMTAVHSEGKFAKEEEIQREELSKMKKNLSEKELMALINDTQMLKTYQTQADTESQKQTIPRLNLEDIPKEITKLDTKVLKKDYGELLKTIYPSNGVSYITMSFDLSNIEEEYLERLGIFASLIGKVDTEKMNYEKLDNQIYINTGGIRFGLGVEMANDDTEKYFPRFQINSKSTPGFEVKMLELIREIVKDSNFENKKRVEEVLKMTKAQMESSMEGAGSAVATAQVLKLLRGGYNFSERMTGLDFYLYLKEFLKDFENNFEKLIEDIYYLMDEVFQKGEVIVSISGDEENLEILEESLDIFFKDFDRFKESKISMIHEDSHNALGLANSSNVQYVVKGFDFKKHNIEYEGSMLVLAAVLSGSYLHGNIRALGGAYGTGCSFNRYGLGTFYSYRDPKLLQTLKVYDEAFDFIENLELTERELANYIISVMNAIDPPLSQSMIAPLVLARHIKEFDYEEQSKIKSQALSTDLNKLKELAGSLKLAYEDSKVVVFGNKQKIEENSELFDEIIKLD